MDRNLLEMQRHALISGAKKFVLAVEYVGIGARVGGRYDCPAAGHVTFKLVFTILAYNFAIIIRLYIDKEFIICNFQIEAISNLPASINS